MAEKEEKKEIPAKRQHKRFDVTSCWLTYARKGLFSYKKPIQDAQCSVISMSRGGVRFLCVEEMKVGQKLMLDITWKHGAPVQAKAEVIWTDDQVPKGRYRHRVGVRFTEYVADAWNRLRRWEEKAEAEAAKEA